jgi:N,N'-diacetyllegionaminate synthase
MVHFQVAKHDIGQGPAFLIAEIAQSHDGSLGQAHAFIDAAHRAGADAIKFQTHIAAAESTLDEPFRTKFSRQDSTRLDYWRRMEFTPEQWAGLAAHAAEKSLVFLSSAFSIEAVELLDRIGMPAWKVASGELGSDSLLQSMISTGSPFLVSSGMSGWAEIDALTQRLKSADRAYALLQCTSKYPTPLTQVGLNVLDQMRARYGVPVGLSDHSGIQHPAMAAIARGASVVELHLAIDRSMFGPDVVVSLLVDEFRAVRDFRDALVTIDANPVDKEAVAVELAQMRAMFRRSLAPRRAIQKGERILADMLVSKKPGTGIPESELSTLVGKRAVRDLVPERLIKREDLE